MKYFLFIAMLASVAFAADTTVIFQYDAHQSLPFPSDKLAVADKNQQTGLRMNLTPATMWPGDQANVAAINQLDGFSVNPRIQVCFSGAVAQDTLKQGISIYPLNGKFTAVPVNQITYDTSTNCAYAKPDTVLDPGSKFALLISTAVKNGQKSVVADPDFTSCITKPQSDDYCQSLASAVAKAGAAKIVGGTVFTTMSANDWITKARTVVNSPATPEFVYPAWFPFVFSLSNTDSITWNPDTTDPSVKPQKLRLEELSGVDSIAFGFFLSPQFIDSSNTIPSIPTGKFSLPSWNKIVPVSFHVFFPSTKMPADGYPVVIYGHGLSDSQFGAPTSIASTLAQQGFATVAIEIYGHGYGPGGTVDVVSNGRTVTVPTPGRAATPSGAVIGPIDGCVVLGSAVGIRDCTRQTAVDLMQFVRTLTDFRGYGFGLGLNPAKVYYIGQSEGSIYGTLLQAVEPRIRAAVLNAGGGSSIDIARLAPTARPLGIAYLNAYAGGAIPGLFNVPPSPPSPLPDFNDSYPFRDIVTNPVPGAIPIQDAFEQAEWLDMIGDPLAFAPLLDGQSTAFQFGVGDLEVPNPTESALVRNANAASSAWLLHLDRAAAALNDFGLFTLQMPGVIFPILPHRILSNPTVFDNANERVLSYAEQNQAATYFLKDGKTLANPNKFLPGSLGSAGIFEQLTPATLPTMPNFPVPPAK